MVVFLIADSYEPVCLLMEGGGVLFLFLLYGAIANTHQSFNLANLAFFLHQIFLWKEVYKYATLNRSFT